jgi:UDP-N-acetylmuramate dehydrogenase
MLVEKNVSLQSLNTFGIVARATQLLRLQSLADVLSLPARVASGELAMTEDAPPLVLGGGSNLVLTGDVKTPVLKVQIMGRRLVAETQRHWIVEAGAGENWHDFVTWTLAQGYDGLENMALIPGTVGAAPVQNIGAYGVELQDRFDSLDAFDWTTGQMLTLRHEHCGFGYRDSVFKHRSDLGLADRAIITHVRFALPKQHKPETGYLDLQRKVEAAQAVGEWPPHGKRMAEQIYDWVCEIRRAKLPDPAVIGNVGSFFKNPTVSADQCADIIAREPNIVHYPMPDGSIKLAAGWLIDACGWKGKSVGNAAVYEKQALVLVNRGGRDNPATGGEVMTLAKAIQTSVYERFGIRLEPEPVVV